MQDINPDEVMNELENATQRFLQASQMLEKLAEIQDCYSLSSDEVNEIYLTFSQVSSSAFSIAESSEQMATLFGNYAKFLALHGK